MRIFTKGSDSRTEEENNQVNKWKLKMAGCFDFRSKEYHIMSGGSLARLGKKMMRSRSNPDISPSKKSATNDNKVTSKSPPDKPSPGGTAHRRRFVRVVREDSKDNGYHNPHVKRKTSDTTPPKKIDYEELNRRYFSDSDSDSSESPSKRDLVRAHSEERTNSPVVHPGPGLLQRGLSLDSEITRRTHFKEEVNVIAFDKKGKQVYTASERIHFDHFEVCDIRGANSQDMCLESEFDPLESISETPELAKSPPKLLESIETAKVELEKAITEKVTMVKMQKVSGNSMDSESDKENATSPGKPLEGANGAEPESTSDVERETQSDSEIRPRTSSFDQKKKALRMFGFLFRSGSESFNKMSTPGGSPKSSPNQLRRHHRYRRILRDSDHGDEYYNPHVVRRSNSSRLSRSVGNINDLPRPILRKHASMDLPDPPDKNEHHAHFQPNVEVVEFRKKDKCVDFVPTQHVQVDQLKSDSETDSVDEITEDVFAMHCDNTDPGVSSDCSMEDLSTVGREAGP